MKQLVVPNTSAMCAVLHSTILAVKKLSSKGVVLGMAQVRPVPRASCLAFVLIKAAGGLTTKSII
jgi:hypothetical protein